jgi:hypothetical protein
MSHERRETGGHEPWWTMGKSLIFVFGVPIGIFVGVLVGAAFEVTNVPHSAAWGLLIGVASAVLIGGAVGRKAARTKYKWVQIQLAVVSDSYWTALIMALNVKAADEHYLVVRRDADYVAYSPALVRPIVAGPMTVSGEYLNVVVARLNATTVSITGPQYMVDAFEAVLKEPKPAAEAT